jgi:hypothetical protein
MLLKKAYLNDDRVLIAPHELVMSTATNNDERVRPLIDKLLRIWWREEDLWVRVQCDFWFHSLVQRCQNEIDCRKMKFEGNQFCESVIGNRLLSEFDYRGTVCSKFLWASL